MTRKTRYPDNVIPVNFKKKPKNPDMKSLYPDAFTMYVDTESDHPDDFSKAVLETLKQEKNAALKTNHPAEGNSPKVLKVYAAEWCPHCTKTIDYLNANTIQFEYYEIENQPEEIIKEIIQVNGGDDWVVPTLEFGGKWREGKIFNAAELKSDLHKLGLTH